MGESFPLSSGRVCVLHHPPLPFLAHYHVLVFPHHQGPPSEKEIEEILLLANRKGRELGRSYFGDEECFSLIYNGGRTRRKPWLHVHILPTRNTAAKRIAFLAFSLKKILRPMIVFRLARSRREAMPWPL